MNEMNCETRMNGNLGTLDISGRFTFDSHPLFKIAQGKLLETPGLQEINLELSGVTYMDSSALGLLLLLREKATERGIKLVLLNPNPSVLNTLKVVQFVRLFEIVT